MENNNPKDGEKKTTTRKSTTKKVPSTKKVASNSTSSLSTPSTPKKAPAKKSTTRKETSNSTSSLSTPSAPKKAPVKKSTTRKEASSSTSSLSTPSAPKKARCQISTTTSSAAAESSVRKSAVNTRSKKVSASIKSNTPQQSPEKQNTLKSALMCIVTLVVYALIIVNLLDYKYEPLFGADDAYEGVYCADLGYYRREAILIFGEYNNKKNRGRVRCSFSNGAGGYRFFQGYYKKYNGYVEIEGLHSYICESLPHLDKEKVETCYAKLYGDRLELKYPLYYNTPYSENNSAFFVTFERTDNKYLNFLFM